jgi:hypothetical protein
MVGHGSDRCKRRPKPSSATSTGLRSRTSNRADRSPRPSSPGVPELGTLSVLLSPVFFGLTARVIPLRSSLRVFSFHGSRLRAWVPPITQMPTCDSTPLALAPRQIGDDRVERAVRLTLEEAPKRATHWSSRALAARTGLSQSTVSRIWRALWVASSSQRNVSVIQ